RVVPRDLHSFPTRRSSDLLQRLPVHGQVLGGSAAWQIASVKQTLALRACQSRRRKDKINVRSGGDSEAIEIFAAAAKEKVVNLEVIYATHRRHEIEQAAA